MLYRSITGLDGLFVEGGVLRATKKTEQNSSKPHTSNTQWLVTGHKTKHNQLATAIASSATRNK